MAGGSDGYRKGPPGEYRNGLEFEQLSTCARISTYRRECGQELVVALYTLVRRRRMLSAHVPREECSDMGPRDLHLNR